MLARNQWRFKVRRRVDWGTRIKYDLDMANATTRLQAQGTVGVVAKAASSAQAPPKTRASTESKTRAATRERPADDIALEREVVLRQIPELAEYLQAHLGQRLTAYLAGIKDAKAVGQWIQGRAEPSAIARERLRAGYHAAVVLSDAFGDRAAQGWFFGANSALDDRAPAAVLREAGTPDEIARIAPLAKAFVRGAL